MPNPFVFYLKKGDTKNPIRAQLVSESTKAAVNMTAVTSVVFVMMSVDDDTSAVTELVNAAATVEDAATGILKYQWVSGDTTTEGTHLGRFVITWNDGKTESVPAGGYFEIQIEDPA